MALKCVLLNVSVKKAIILSNTDCFKCSNTLYTALYHFIYKVVLCVYLFEIDNWASSYITAKLPEVFPETKQQMLPLSLLLQLYKKIRKDTQWYCENSTIHLCHTEKNDDCFLLYHTKYL